MPTSPAMASSVVPSNPRSANSRNAARSISAWLVAGGRPSREAPCAVAITRDSSNTLLFVPRCHYSAARHTPRRVRPAGPPRRRRCPVPTGCPTPGPGTRGSRRSPSRQSRAKKRLPWSVYGALVAGSERGVSADDNTAAFAELGFAPHIAGQKPERHMNTTVMGLPISLPVVISPTGVQAVHPQGEVAVARAAAARGTVIGLSNFASKSDRGGRGGQPEHLLPDVLDRRPRRHDPAHGPRPRRRRQGPDRHPRLVVLHGPRLGQPGDPGEDRPQDDDPAGARR